MSQHLRYRINAHNKNQVGYDIDRVSRNVFDSLYLHDFWANAGGVHFMTSRDESLEAIDELHALMLLGGEMDPQWQSQLKQLRDASAGLTDRNELQRRRTWLDERVNLGRATYGVKVDRQTLLGILKQLQTTAPGEIFWIRKDSLSKILTYYDQGDDPIPQHWYVGIDVNGSHNCKFPDFPVRIPEASLFEDMCALYNMAVQAEEECAKDPTSKVALKRSTALIRSAGLASYHYVEAYLNGIAYDYVVRHRETLDPKSLAFLTERDSFGRNAWVTTREKLLHYPRLILGLQHPPLQENNCEEMKHFIDKLKPLRDALAHQSPGIEASTGNPEKQFVVLRLSLQDLSIAVDCSIELIRRVDGLFEPNPLRIHWLVTRAIDGLFPTTAFD